VALSATGDLGGNLAAGGLFVDGSFGGQHQIGASDGRLEVDVIEHHLEAGQKLRAEHGESGAQTAGGPGTGRGPQIEVHFAFQNLGPPLHGRRQQLDLLWGGALLGAEHPRDAPLPAQHVVRIHRDEDLHPGEAGIEPGQVDGIDLGQGSAPAGDRKAHRIQR
jgi:hypothetical protein